MESNSIISAVVQQRVNTFHHAVDVSFVTCPAYPNSSGLVFELRGHMESYHQDRNLWQPSSDFLCRIQAVHYWHLKVKNYDIGSGLLCSLDGLSAVGRFTADFPRLLLFQQSSQAAAHKLAVVNNKDSDGCAFRPCIPHSHRLNLRGRTHNVYTQHRVGLRAFLGSHPFS